MSWEVLWDGPYVTGGDPARRLTPNFRLREFAAADGQVRVHRELVTAIQVLRSRLGTPLRIVAVDANGLGAELSAPHPEALIAATDALRAHRLFERIEPRGESVRVRIPEPHSRREIELEQALETAFSVTSAFETTGDRFQQVTGNFDDAGLSFGPAQWNFRSGTLPPLFFRFIAADEDAFRACFDEPEDHDEWVEVLSLPVDRQIAWADAVSCGRGKHEVAQPWRGYLKAVGRVEAFRSIMVDQALRKYGARLVDAIQYLQGLAPGIVIDHLRCVCALYDLVIQQGSLYRARDAIERAVAKRPPADQFELVAVAVEQRGRAANPRWRADCISRRLGILNGVPETVDGCQRANLNFYLLRDVHIRNATGLIDADVDDRLARVSEALGSGRSLLG